jgi:hypothetical protein
VAGPGGSCDDRRVSFLRWFKKPTPAVWEVPGVGPKPLKDLTDEEIEASVGFWERIEWSRLTKYVTYDQLLDDALRSREKERQRVSRSRFSVGFSMIRFWLEQRWWDWRYRRRRDEGEQDAAVAGESIETELAWGPGGSPDSLAHWRGSRF